MLLNERGADPDRADELVERYRDHYRTVSLAETRAFPGIPGAVRSLASRYRLAVATSKPEVFARPILEVVELAGAFAHIIGPPLVETHQEDKTGTLGRALDSLTVVASPSGDAPRAAMVGDRRFDMAAGRQHGIATVGVTWGIGDRQELRQAGADLLVDTPDQLASLFP
jgi:phosphoglycolate phosphatase